MVRSYLPNCGLRRSRLALSWRRIARIILIAGKSFSFQRLSQLPHLTLPSSPALVRTLSLLGKSSPAAVVAIAMKMRHSSEQVFFDLMADAGFVPTAKLTFALPGDAEVGEESVDLHVYNSSNSSSK